MTFGATSCSLVWQVCDRCKAYFYSAVNHIWLRVDFIICSWDHSLAGEVILRAYFLYGLVLVVSCLAPPFSIVTSYGYLFLDAWFILFWYLADRRHILFVPSLTSFVENVVFCLSDLFWFSSPWDFFEMAGHVSAWVTREGFCPPSLPAHSLDGSLLWPHFIWVGFAHSDWRGVGQTPMALWAENLRHAIASSVPHSRLQDTFAVSCYSFSSDTLVVNRFTMWAAHAPWAHISARLPTTGHLTVHLTSVFGRRATPGCIRSFVLHYRMPDHLYTGLYHIFACSHFEVCGAPAIHTNGLTGTSRFHVFLSFAHLASAPCLHLTTARLDSPHGYFTFVARRFSQVSRLCMTAQYLVLGVIGLHSSHKLSILFCRVSLEWALV